MSVEISEEEVEPANGAEIPSLEKNEIIDYLKHGGLIAMLRSNLAGGKNQPRVWLCRDTLGNVTHTFAEDRGLLGGGLVPFGALQDGGRIEFFAEHGDAGGAHSSRVETASE